MTPETAYSFGQLGLAAFFAAAMTSLFNLIIARGNREHEHDRERMKRRQELLERIAEQIEDVHCVLVEVSVLASTWRNIAKDVQANLELKQKMYELWQRLDKGHRLLQPIEGKLLLIGLPTSAATLSNYRREIVVLLPRLTPSIAAERGEEIFSMLMMCNERHLELYGRLANAYCGKDDKLVPKEYLPKQG